MAALAECCQISKMIVPRVMIQVRARKHHPRKWDHSLPGQLYHTQLSGETIGRGMPTHPPAAIIAPALSLVIVPTTIAEVVYLDAVRPAAVFAAALARLNRTKADSSRQSIGYSQRCSGRIGMIDFSSGLKVMAVSLRPR